MYLLRKRETRYYTIEHKKYFKLYTLLKSINFHLKHQFLNKITLLYLYKYLLTLPTSL